MNAGWSSVTGWFDSVGGLSDLTCLHLHTNLVFSSNEGAHTGSTEGHLKQAHYQLRPCGRLAGQAGYLTLQDPSQQRQPRSISASSDCSDGGSSSSDTKDDRAAVVPH